MKTLMTTAVALAGLVLAGCSGGSETTSVPAVVKSNPAPARVSDAAVPEERAKLDPEMLKLVEAQEWCVVANANRLGSMGPPVKLMVKDTPVFLCCQSCEKKA